MSAAKKIHRENGAISGYRTAVVEELGDTLWYFATLCRRLDYDLEKIFADVTTNKHYLHTTAASDVPDYPISTVSGANAPAKLDDVLVKLGAATSKLFSVSKKDKKTHRFITIFCRHIFTNCSNILSSFCGNRQLKCQKDTGAVFGM